MFLLHFRVTLLTKKFIDGKVGINFSITMVVNAHFFPVDILSLAKLNDRIAL